MIPRGEDQIRLGHIRFDLYSFKLHTSTKHKVLDEPSAPGSICGRNSPLFRLKTLASAVSLLSRSNGIAYGCWISVSLKKGLHLKHTLSSCNCSAPLYTSTSFLMDEMPLIKHQRILGSANIPRTSCSNVVMMASQ